MGFTSIPNELDDSDLDVYQYRIWSRIKRRGICFESQRSIADSTGISLAQVNRTVKWLRSNDWIEPSIDKKSAKIGYCAVIPQEQTQQNSVIPGEHVIPEVEHVIPQERHLKKNLEEINNNKAREDETLIAFFEGMTGFTRPHDTTDDYADDWLAPTQAILKQSADFGEAEKRLTWAIQEMRRKRYTIKSPKSCLTMALNWHDPSLSNGHAANGRVDDADVWDKVLQHARNGDTGFTDPQLIAAVKRFGWRKLQDIRPGDENFHRKAFMRIYNEQQTTTA